MSIADIVESSREFSWAHIDCGLHQGRKAILTHLQVQFEDYKEDEYSSVDLWVSWMQDALSELTKHVSPYQMPNDYKDFLEYYGGFAIDGIDCHFSVLGVGPMTENWYGNINADNHDLWNLGKAGWLKIGRLVFQRNHKYYGQRVLFYLDLAGFIQKNCVIAIGPWNGTDPKELVVLEDVRANPSLWKKTADSFGEWLINAIKTRGMFLYM
ncbi:MAG: hypothetical protein KPEEDBHJ_00196 [Anaerolineales bacterium]|nr:hypothetical protein [Anaerolineales bacterium]